MDETPIPTHEMTIAVPLDVNEQSIGSFEVKVSVPITHFSNEDIVSEIRRRELETDFIRDGRDCDNCPSTAPTYDETERLSDLIAEGRTVEALELLHSFDRNNCPTPTLSLHLARVRAADSARASR